MFKLISTNHFISTFRCLHLLLISATLACNVAMFQIISFEQNPAAFTPDLMQSSFF